MMAMRSAVAFLSAFLMFGSGCASLTQGQAGEPDYAALADENLRLGGEALENKDFFRAQKYFEYVRTKFPYQEAAREAELRLADLDFEREAFPEAKEQYQAFIKLHPTHAKVDYAAFQSAMTHVKAYPSEFFALPPSKEKDQGEIRSALVAMEEFRRQYPNSQYANDAKVHWEDARRRLASHEMYAADFYESRERWKAVVQRLEGLLRRYPGTEYEERALFNLHAAYLKLNETEKAQDTLRQVLRRLPGTPAAERAQRMLGS
ncbi:Competence protein ComL precursor [Myxococcus hansupus]|uniref:Competence protein ComL n=2 Tax=Pseudomyxococcus hansupus TaxID=1297742 RepID=A0A0H4X2K9_9BACT|nr:Competence protein ComL precursor [Myxococcus hansupus]